MRPTYNPTGAVRQRRDGNAVFREIASYLLPYEVLIAQPNEPDKTMFAIEFLSNQIRAALTTTGLNPARSSLDSTHR